MIFILSFAFLLIAFLCVALAFTMDVVYLFNCKCHLLPSWILPKSLR